MELDKVTPETFEPHVGSAFSIATEAATTELVLENVFLSGSGSPLRPRGFSLIFRLESAEALPQRIYELSHDALGLFSLFLVPISLPGKGVRYEAVFN